jgi:hypothetical protein
MTTSILLDSKVHQDEVSQANSVAATSWLVCTVTIQADNIFSSMFYQWRWRKTSKFQYYLRQTCLNINALAPNRDL